MVEYENAYLSLPQLFSLQLPFSFQNKKAKIVMKQLEKDLDISRQLEHIKISHQYVKEIVSIDQYETYKSKKPFLVK